MAWLILKRIVQTAPRPAADGGGARAACEACGAAFREYAFCIRCGAERFPKHRWSTAPPRRTR